MVRGWGTTYTLEGTVPKTKLTARLCVMACTLTLLTGCPGISEFMKAYGYTELRPPSTLLAPGAMVAVVSRHPLQVKILCGPRASLGEAWEPVHSMTHSSEFKRARKKSFDIDVDLLSQVKSNVELSAVNNITMKFDQARIVELTDLDVMANMKYRSADCRRAIAARRAAGFEVSMVSSGLMGDVVYSIDWDNSVQMSAEAKITALQNLAISLGGGSSMVGTNTIHSKGLTWGIKDDMFLADLSMPDDSRNNVRRGTMLFSPEEADGMKAMVEPDPEAELVMPANPVAPPCHGGGFCDVQERLVPVPNAYPAQPTRPAPAKSLPRPQLKPRPTTMFDSVDKGRRQIFGDGVEADDEG